MNLLLVDIGNTQTKYCQANRGKFGMVSCDLTADIERVAKDIAGLALPVVLGSVSKKATDRLKEILAAHQNKISVEIEARLISKPVSGFYDGMGADRIANIVGAWSEYGQKGSVLAIDCGTATTVTAATAEGKFAGGFTTLGLTPICKSLTEFLPYLPPIDLNSAQTLEPGFDKYESLCRGTVSAHVGIIEKWISLFRSQLGEDPTVVLTGGWSKALAPFITYPATVEPILTLKGLWVIAQIYSQ